jgi:hypothetical protein
MEINAIRAELEREDLDDAEYSAMLTEMLTGLE